MALNSGTEISFAKKLFDTIKCGIVMVDVDTRKIIYVNNEALVMTGCREELLLGSLCTEYYCKQDPLACPILDKNMELEDYETFLDRPDGTRIIISKTANTVLYNNKKYLVESFINITALKENETRVHSLLELSESTFESEEDISRFALNKAVELTNSKIGYIHLVNSIPGAETNLDFFVWASTQETMPCTAQYTKHYPLSKAGMWADCIRTGKPVVHNDYVNEPNKKGLPEGHFKLIRHLSVPVRNGNNEIVAVMGVGNKENLYSDFDVEQLQLFANSAWQIIKRKRLDQALTCSESKYKNLVEKAPAAIYEIDFTDMRIITADGNIFNMSGYSKEELLSMSGLELLLPADKIKFENRIKKVLAGEKVPNEVEYAIKTKSGEIRQAFLQTNFRRRKEDDHVIAYVISVDITELKELKQKAKTYLELAPSVFVTFDRYANITFMNKFGMEILECDETIIGKNWFDVFILEKDKKKIYKVFSNLAGGLSEFSAYENEVITCKDNLRVIAWRNTVLKDASGNITDIISAGHDITEKRLSEKELESYWIKEETRLKQHLKPLSILNQSSLGV